MTTRKKTDDSVNPFLNPAKEVQRISVEDEVEGSFLNYAYSVIYSRALPDARDGMQPVQRRIQYGMFDQSYTPEKNHVKSAKIVGHVIGSLHPHGDTACYGSLVRLAQPSSLRVPLVDGHGNFGDTGSPAAAARYTEARLSKEALLLLEELREDTVDVRPNYDNSITEPVVLPAKFPNLLINGATGIAVGMATNIPTHNPGEVMDAARWLLNHPDATVDRLMKFIPGPDFNAGGEIIGKDGISDGYRTGQGKFRIRGRYRVEDIGRGKNRIVFYELPHGVSAEAIITQVKKGISENKITGIVDIKDLTDRKNGTNLTIETKAGINLNVLLADLFKYSSFEVTFGMNHVALVNGEPRTMNLVDMLKVFLVHRKEVVTRRTKNRLEKRERRLHLIEGLMKALLDIDEAIRIIRNAPEVDTAKSRLMRSFKVDDIQAEYILSLQLRRLTKFDQKELNAEKKKLTDESKELHLILDDPEVLRQVINDELIATKKVIDSPRASVIADGDLAEHLEAEKQVVAAASVEVGDEPCHVALLASGAVVRTKEPYKVTNRGKIDPILGSIDTSLRDSFVLVTNKGQGYRVKTINTSEDAKYLAKDLGVKLASGEHFVAIGRSSAVDGEAGLALGTKNGTVKISITDFPTSRDQFPVINLTDKDEVLGGKWVRSLDATEFIFVTSDASLVKFEASKVRPQGSKGAGVAGAKIADGQEAITFAVLTGDERERGEVVTYTGTTIKRSHSKDFPVKGRATAGVRSHTMQKDEKGLQSAAVGMDLVVVNKAGKLVALPDVAKRDGRGTSAVESPATYGTRS